MILVPGDAPPLVFLGPSAPPSDVHALLPGAEIRPPVRRGDLYQARLLRYSVFIVIDGVFAQQESIPPREIVDVLRDGAAVIGAASMGALRATDCYPAGAHGIGTVYRLLRCGAIGSEDEVAVVFDTDKPFPALTESLVSMRVALRHAVRAGVMKAQQARALVTVAGSLPYGERTWKNVFEKTGQDLGESAFSRLRSDIDIKRRDACVTFRRIARRREQDSAWFRRPRRARAVFGGMVAARERPADGLLGRSQSDVEAGFLLWMLFSGRANRFLGGRTTALEILARLDLRLPDNWIAYLDRLDWSAFGDSADAMKAIGRQLEDGLNTEACFDAEHYRHAAISEGIRRAIHSGIEETPHDIAACDVDLSNAHDLAQLEGRVPLGTVRRIRELKLWWSRAKACRRAEIGI